MPIAARGIGTINSLYFDTQEVSNVSTDVTVLNSFTVGKAVLLHDGDSLAFDYYGSFSAAGGSALILTFGDQPLYDTGISTAGGGGFHLFGRVVRYGASLQKAFATLVCDFSQASTFTPLTLNESDALTFELKAQGGSSDKITAEGAYITFCGGPS